MAVYLSLLKRHSLRFKLDIIAYCLMINHVHLVVIPGDEKSMANAIGKTHGHYAQHINRKNNSTGHLWEDRFYSCPMDEQHFWIAARYVERNPVKAGIVNDPWEYEWSSARAHVQGEDEYGILNMDYWLEMLGDKNWMEFAGQSDIPDDVDELLRCTREGKPLGNKKYFEDMKNRKK